MPDKNDSLEQSTSPVCPHCAADPITITVNPIVFPNGVQLLVASCGNLNCRKIISASFMGMQQPRIMPVPGRIIGSPS